MNKFINRESELAQLESQYAGNSGSLVVLYGRRRLGKTSLLRKFAEDKPHWNGANLRLVWDFSLDFCRGGFSWGHGPWIFGVL
jgi:predicted AAA+ superfamily ATPase